MKSMVSIIGLILVIIGIAVLAYQGITYTKRETVAQIGNIELTADTQKNGLLSTYRWGRCTDCRDCPRYCGAKTPLS